MHFGYNFKRFKSFMNSSKLTQISVEEVKVIWKTGWG